MPTVTTKPPTIPPRIERLLLAPLFVLPVLWLTGYFFPPINHDVAAILDVSTRWIGGEKLYVEVLDENLPLTFVIHGLPVLTAKILPGTVAFWFTAWVVACSCSRCFPTSISASANTSCSWPARLT